MIRMVQNSSAGGAKQYFATALEREDYHTQESPQESPGRWGGKAADTLGLEGEVEKEAFHNLVENQHPETGERLTARTRPGRTVGYDVSFHAVKSVSLLHALGEDADRVEVEAAFRQAVQDTMERMEEDMRTRVRISGANEDRLTQNALWAEFVHQTARPIDGIPDPHLHSHCFVFNCTFDNVEDRWKAGQFQEINRQMPYYQAVFHNHLAQAMQELGYSVEKTEAQWEISGVPESLLDRFSRRTAQIEEVAEAKGIQHDPDRKGALGALTRDWKERTGIDDLRDAWRSWLSEDEQQTMATLFAREQETTGPEIAEREALQRALLSAFDGKASVSENRLIGEALRHGVGSVEEADLRAQLDQMELLQFEQADGSTRIVTLEASQLERSLAATINEQKGTLSPLIEEIDPDTIADLSPRYQAALSHVIGSKDRITAISYRDPLLRERVQMLLGEDGGAVVPVFTEIGAERAQHPENAVIRFLEYPDEFSIMGDLMWWLDDPGKMPDEQLKQVFELAEERDARVVLAGKMPDKYLLDEVLPRESLPAPPEPVPEPVIEPEPPLPELAQNTPEIEAQSVSAPSAVPDPAPPPPAPTPEPPPPEPEPSPEPAYEPPPPEPPAPEIEGPSDGMDFG